VATTDPKGQSHSATAFFCYSSESELFFLTNPDSVHGRNLVSNPSMAWTVYDSTQEWGKPLAGAQLIGEATLAGTVDTARAITLYGIRFPAFALHVARSSPQELLSDPHKVYVFRPKQVKLLDEAAFGPTTFVTARFGEAA